MEFDFDRFEKNFTLAEKHVSYDEYSRGEMLGVFRYYFETFEDMTDYIHPMINLPQLCGIMRKMPMTADPRTGEAISIEPWQYKILIDCHFATEYRDCDYNINHFFSGDIRGYRYIEAFE